jgi:hypothetical protein
VQYWNGSTWATVPNGSVTNNNRVVKRVTFPAVTTTRIRVVVNNALANYSRIVELEAWTPGTGSASVAEADSVLRQPDAGSTFAERLIGLSDYAYRMLQNNW